MHYRGKSAGSCGPAGALVAVLVATALVSPQRAAAEEKEAFATLELGAAAEWTLPNGSAGFGPSAAVEFNVIPDWLVIEPGISPLFSRGQTEWDVDLVFKKPFDLSPAVEFEPGIGPAWQHTIAGGRTTDNPAVEITFEFMLRPPHQSFGWFVEPSFSNAFGPGNQRSLGLTTGLLIPLLTR
jgi:hypothetical protein